MTRLPLSKITKVIHTNCENEYITLIGKSSINIMETVKMTKLPFLKINIVNITDCENEHIILIGNKRSKYYGDCENDHITLIEKVQ